jgi:hypothetical protein
MVKRLPQGSSGGGRTAPVTRLCGSQFIGMLAVLSVIVAALVSWAKEK